MAQDNHYDVIIIGTGAGGGTLAYQLAPSGKRILLLERGDFVPRELENWDAEQVFVKNRYVSPDTWYDEHNQPFQPQIHYVVGGATKLYGAALYRLREQDDAGSGNVRQHRAPPALRGKKERAHALRCCRTCVAGCVAGIPYHLCGCGHRPASDVLHRRGHWPAHA